MRAISIPKRIALRLLMSCVVGVASGASEHVIDAALAARGLTALNTLVDDYLTGILVGTVVFCLSLYIDERNQRQRTRQRLIALAEMNHHLRNALAVLKLSPEIEDATALTTATTGRIRPAP